MSLGTQAIVTYLATGSEHGPSYWIAVIGMTGVVVGALVSAFGAIAIHLLKVRPRKVLDKQRYELLVRMLRDPRFPQKWRRISTLSGVIGASEATTRRLLISIGARASESNHELWGLIEFHPLSEVEQ